MKKRHELHDVFVCVRSYSSGGWEYELWEREPENLNWKYAGSNEFQYKTPEDALKAGLEHREEVCKPEEE